MHMHSASRVRRGSRPLARVAGTLLILAWCGVAAAREQPPSPADPTSTDASSRPSAGATPGQVAEPDHVTLDALLADRARLEGALGALRTELARRQDHVEALEAEVHDAGAERAALQRRLSGYTTVRTVAVIAVGAALGSMAALLLALSRARDEHHRRVVLVKNSEVLRDAVERYRNLGAQLELEYQSLSRQNGAAGRPGRSAGTLLSDYERERTWVEQDVARSQAAINEALDEMQVA